MLVCPLRFLSVNVALSVAFDIGVLWLPTVPIVEIIFPALTVLAALLPVSDNTRGNDKDRICNWFTPLTALPSVTLRKKGRLFRIFL